jgi:hypothetical protein
VTSRWRPYRALSQAILKTSLRNPVASFGLFAVLMLMLAGVKYLDSARFSATSVRVADEAATPASRHLLRELRGTPGFTVGESTAADARRAVDAGQTDVAVVIPPGFGATDEAGRLRPAEVAVTYRAGGGGNQARSLIAADVDLLDRGEQGAPQLLTVRPDVRNAGLGLIDLFLPGLLSFNVIQSALMAAAGAFAGYRSAGVLRRVQATGVTPANLVLAHATALFVVGAAQVGLMLAAARLLFTVHLDLAGIFAVAMLGYLVFLAAGLAISGWVRDAQRAPAIATALGKPMIFIGLFPPQIFSGGVAAVIGMLPVSFVTHGVRMLVEGAGLSAIGADLLGLGGWAVVLLAAASGAFRWDD